MLHVAWFQLDLTVITRDGVIHYPNSLAGADRLNNVEGITLTSVAAGTIQIRIRGYNVPNGPQPYALVIRGAGAASTAVVTPVSADFDGDGKADPALQDPATGAWRIKLSALMGKL